MKKTVFITGATAGIGKACAEKFASEGCRLILTGRRRNLLKELKENLEKAFETEVWPLTMDVRDREKTEKAIVGLEAPWNRIDLLVNNAGLAVGFGHLQDGNPEDWDRMVDTNVKGLLYVTRFVLPMMKGRPGAQIINLGSVAGKEIYENGNVYCATKHAVDALSRAMRIDLLEEGIKVTNIAPGLVETEFSLVRFNGDEQQAKKPYEGIDPLTAEDIAEVIYFTATTPPHMNINDVVITPIAQAGSNHIVRH